MSKYKIHKGEIHQILEVRSNGEKITDFKENLKKGCIKINEQTKENRGGKRDNAGRKKIANPLTERLAFRVLPGHKADFIEAAGGIENLKDWIMAACREAVMLKRTRGF